MSFKMTKDMSLSHIIYNTIMIDRGWDNEEIPLLYTIPEKERLDVANELIHKDFGIVINQNFFIDGQPNNVLKDVDYRKLKEDWDNDVNMYDIYLMEILHPRIIEYLNLHNLESVKISIDDALNNILDTSIVDTYLLTKTKIKQLE